MLSSFLMSDVGIPEDPTPIYENHSSSRRSSIVPSGIRRGDLIVLGEGDLSSSSPDPDWWDDLHVSDPTVAARFASGAYRIADGTEGGTPMSLGGASGSYRTTCVIFPSNGWRFQLADVLKTGNGTFSFPAVDSEVPKLIVAHFGSDLQLTLTSSMSPQTGVIGTLNSFIRWHWMPPGSTNEDVALTFSSVYAESLSAWVFEAR